MMVSQGWGISDHCIWALVQEKVTGLQGLLLCTNLAASELLGFKLVWGDHRCQMQDVCLVQVDHLCWEVEFAVVAKDRVTDIDEARVGLPQSFHHSLYHLQQAHRANVPCIVQSKLFSLFDSWRGSGGAIDTLVYSLPLYHCIWLNKEDDVISWLRGFLIQSARVRLYLLRPGKMIFSIAASVTSSSANRISIHCFWNQVF